MAENGAWKKDKVLEEPDPPRSVMPEDDDDSNERLRKAHLWLSSHTEGAPIPDWVDKAINRA